MSRGTGGDRWVGLFDSPDGDLQLVEPIDPQRLLRYRAAASLVDGLLSHLLGILLAVFVHELLLAGGVVSGDLSGDKVMIWTVALATVYFLLLESVLGTTIGKRVFGLRVVSDDGTIHTVPQTVVRNLLRPLDQLSFLGVFLIPGLTSQQRLGDLAAGTIVGRASKPTEAFHDPPHRHASADEMVIVPGSERTEGGSRAIAGIVDVLPAFLVGLFAAAIVLISLEGTVTTVIPGTTGPLFLPDALPPIALNLLVLVMMAVYHPLMEATWGTTLGRRLVSLRVASPDGTAPVGSQLFVRNILRPVDYLLLPVTAAALAFSEQRQRPSDLVAGTIAGRRKPNRESPNSTPTDQSVPETDNDLIEV